LTVDNRKKLPQTAATISRKMRNQYVLGYTPKTESDGRWRKMKVRVNSSAAKEPLHAFYKEGYTATEK